MAQNYATQRHAYRLAKRKEISLRIVPIAAAFIISSTPVSANGCQEFQPDGGAVLLGSHHVDAQADFNETNPGIFFSWNCNVVNIRIGVHKNSFSDLSTSLTFTSDFASLSAHHFSVHPYIGVAHYPETGHDMPVNIGGTDVIAMMGLEFTHDQAPFFVQVLPGDTTLVDYAYLWTFGVKFGL